VHPGHKKKNSVDCRNKQDREADHTKRLKRGHAGHQRVSPRKREVNW